MVKCRRHGNNFLGTKQSLRGLTIECKGVSFDSFPCLFFFVLFFFFAREQNLESFAYLPGVVKGEVYTGMKKTIYEVTLGHAKLWRRI